MKILQHISLVNPNKVLMAPLHIKLLKNFVTAINKHRLNSFKFLCKTFFKLSQTKFKEKIFVRPEIWKVFEDPEFQKTLKTLELLAWI